MCTGVNIDLHARARVCVFVYGKIQSVSLHTSLIDVCTNDAVAFFITNRSYAILNLRMILLNLYFEQNVR